MVNRAMIFRNVITLIGGIAFVTSSPVLQGGLIVNGDFEVFDTNFFANYGTPVTSNGWTFSNQAGVENFGNPGRAARLESNGSSTTDPTITQVVSGLTVGESYHLSWDLALRVSFSGSGTGRSFGVFLDSQTFANSIFMGEYLSSTYLMHEVNFIATATSHTLIFAGELDNRTNGGLGNTDVSYRIDNIHMTVSPTPEPNSLLLTGSITCVVAGFRRRKK